MQLNVGDIITMKKKHPCGSSDWEVLRVGQDLRIKCLGCAHQLMIARRNIEKSIKKVNKDIPGKS